MPRLELQLTSPGICRVMSACGLHVGNLKRIGSVWKFKAIGYDDEGRIVPGGGPMTGKHNADFDTLDAARVNEVLGCE